MQVTMSLSTLVGSSQVNSPCVMTNYVSWICCGLKICRTALSNYVQVVDVQKNKEN